MEPILKLEKIKKVYGGVVAVDNISLEFEGAKVHAIVGENGAGKSTFIKIMTGAQTQTEGNIYLDGNLLKDNSPKLSLENKISAVYQELNLVPSLTVYENIFLGNELKKGLFLDKKSMKEESLKLLESMKVNIRPEEKVENLGMGNRQIVEIAKALAQKARLIIFDEPTASLTEQEIERLMEIISDLRAKGLGIVYISHKLEEVFRIADEISVFRDGKHIESMINDKSEVNLVKKEYLIKQIAGRELKVQTKESSYSSDEILLELKNFSTEKVKNINFKLKKGEILSISGLLGSMRTEVLEAVFGLENKISGEVIVNGKKVQIKSPQDAIKLGIGFVSEDRKDSGLFMERSIRENSTIVFLQKFIEFGRINKSKEINETKRLLESLTVKYNNLEQKAKELSGGNQQKLAIGKWLMEDLDIILLDEPTRGVDVGAKEELYRLIFQLAESGKGIIIVSSEAEEVIRLSDRTLVMSKGQIVKNLCKEDISSEAIFKASSEGGRV